MTLCTLMMIETVFECDVHYQLYIHDDDKATICFLPIIIIIHNNNKE